MIRRSASYPGQRKSTKVDWTPDRNIKAKAVLGSSPREIKRISLLPAQPVNSQSMKTTKALSLPTNPQPAKSEAPPRPSTPKPESAPALPPRRPRVTPPKVAQRFSKKYLGQLVDGRRRRQSAPGKSSSSGSRSIKSKKKEPQAPVQKLQAPVFHGKSFAKAKMAKISEERKAIQKKGKEERQVTQSRSAKVRTGSLGSRTNSRKSKSGKTKISKV